MTTTTITIKTDLAALATSKTIPQPDELRIYPDRVETIADGEVDATFDTLALCLDELGIPLDALGEHLAQVMAGTI
jgi:hypothetical protein